MSRGVKAVIQRRGLRKMKRRAVSCHARSVYIDSNKENGRVPPDKRSQLWRRKGHKPQACSARKCRSQCLYCWEEGESSGRSPNWA